MTSEYEFRAPSRTVVFRSRRARLVWGAIALVPLLAGLYLIRPLLSEKPPPLHPWGLTIATASEKDPGIKGFSTFLRLYVTAKHGCGNPARAEGELEWAPRIYSKYSYAQLSPRRIAFGVAGADVVGGEIRRLDGPGWLDLKIRHLEPPFEGTLLYSPRLPPFGRHIPRGDISTGLGAFRFRLFVHGVQPSGYGSCELANPVLIEHPGESAVMAEAGTATGDLEFDRLPGEVAHDRVIDDAVVWSSIPGKRPDPSTLGSNAQVRNGRVLAGCTEQLSGKFSNIDIYRGQRAFYERSTCGGVNRFEAFGSQDTLTRNAFFGGILISAALGLLLEVVVTGATGRRRSRDSAQLSGEAGQSTTTTSRRSD